MSWHLLNPVRNVETDSINQTRFGKLTCTNIDPAVMETRKQRFMQAKTSAADGCQAASLQNIGASNRLNKRTSSFLWRAF